jgi:hypothetical protein
MDHSQAHRQTLENPPTIERALRSKSRKGRHCCISTALQQKDMRTFKQRPRAPMHTHARPRTPTCVHAHPHGPSLSLNARRPNGGVSDTTSTPPPNASAAHTPHTLATCNGHTGGASFAEGDARSPPRPNAREVQGRAVDRPVCSVRVRWCRPPVRPPLKSRKGGGPVQPPTRGPLQRSN